MNGVALRPKLMWIDPARCVHCGLCEEFMPEIGTYVTGLPVTGQSLEAMSACPAGAIRWLEGEEQDEQNRRA